jgi:PAS domain-containing protein
VPIHDEAGSLLYVQHQMHSKPPAGRPGPDREVELRKLFESSYDVIALVDAYGRFTFVTPSIRNVLGYSEQEYINAPPMALVHPEDVAGFGAEVNRLFAQPGALMLVCV